MNPTPPYDNDTLPIAFDTGGEPVTAPMAWGQVAIWDVLRWLPPTDTSTHLLLELPAPPGTTAERAADAVRLLVERHDSLRTLFFEAAEGPRQRVVPRGMLRARLHPVAAADAAGEAGAAGAADVTDVADVRRAVERVGARLRATAFGATELPVRMAVVTDGPHAAAVVLCLSHLALDGWSLAVVRADLTALLTEPETLPPRAQQPLERAEYEASEPARRGQDRALRYWERAVRELPAAMLEDLRDGGASDPQWARIESPALALAAAEHARRVRLSPSLVLQAGVLLLLAVYTGERSAALRTIVATRFRPENQSLVGAFNQNALVHARLGDEPFDAFVHRVGTAATTGYRHTEYEPRSLELLIERIGKERGMRTGGFCFFNDVRFDAGRRPFAPVPRSAREITAALARTQLSVPDWDIDQKGAKFFLYVQELGAGDSAAEATAALTLCADRRFLAGRESADFLLDLQWLLTETVRRNISTGALAGALRERSPLPT